MNRTGHGELLAGGNGADADAAGGVDDHALDAAGGVITDLQIVRVFDDHFPLPRHAADSVARAGRFQPQRDSLLKAGVTADSVNKLEMASEGRGEGGGEEEEGPRRRQPAPRVANKAGLNTFAWNLRYPDASTFENMILWAGGTQGPVAPPGRVAMGAPSRPKPQLRPSNTRSSLPPYWFT